MYNLSDGVRHNFSMNDKIFLHQAHVIQQVAGEGPCIIVGCCADYVLKERDNVIKVFIYADMESRRRRIVNVYQETDEKALSDIEKNDKKREDYYNFCSGRKFGEAGNYDICLNSSLLGIDKCVQILKEAWLSMKEKNC